MGANVSSYARNIDMTRKESGKETKIRNIARTERK